MEKSKKKRNSPVSWSGNELHLSLLQHLMEDPSGISENSLLHAVSIPARHPWLIPIIRDEKGIILVSKFRSFLKDKLIDCKAMVIEQTCKSTYL